MSADDEAERPYTIEEANAALPDLRERLARMKQSHESLLGSTEKLEEGATHNGGGTDSKSYFEAVESLRTDLHALADQNIILRDAGAGLVDFPSERDGEPAFLCWRLGEERVGFWHPTDTGFSGRKPL